MSPSLSERWGAALVQPLRAFAHSEQDGSAGQGPVDLVLLWLLGLVAMQTDSLFRAFYIGVEGNVKASIALWVQVMTHELSLPVVVLFASTCLLWMFAGQKRNLGKDFDLVCVAFIPVVVVHLFFFGIGALFSIEVDGFATLVTWAGYGWGALWWLRALGVARQRTRA